MISAKPTAMVAMLALWGEMVAQENTQDGPWLEPFLRTIPGDVAVAAVVSISPRDFLGQLYGLLEPEEVGLLDDSLRKTGQYEDRNNMMEKIDVALLPRIGLVSRRNIPDPGIPVETPSSMPEVACVFWVRDGMKKPLEDLQEVMIRHYRTLGFENAYELKVHPSLEGTLLEFTNRKIPATGEMAMSLFDDLFVVSNSGPLVRDILTTEVLKRPSLAEGLSALSSADPESGSGVAFIHGRNLRHILDDNEIEQLPAEWLMAMRSLVERGAIGFDPASVVSEEARRSFNRQVDAYLRDLWNEERDARMTLGRAAVVEILRLLLDR